MAVHPAKRDDGLREYANPEVSWGLGMGAIRQTSRQR